MDSLLNSGSFTVLDYIIAALIVISSLMAFARGFLREISSFLAFLLAVAAGWFAYEVISPFVQSTFQLPLSPDTISIGLLIIAFLLVYIIIAVLGRNFARFIQFGDDIGFFDRILGLAFGVARALIVAILGLWLAYLFLPYDPDKPSNDVEIPWIGNSYSYKKLMPSVLWLHENFSGFMDKSDNSVEKPVVSSEDEQN